MKKCLIIIIGVLLPTLAQARHYHHRGCPNGTIKFVSEGTCVSKRSKVAKEIYHPYHHVKYRHIVVYIKPHHRRHAKAEIDETPAPPTPEPEYQFWDHPFVIPGSRGASTITPELWDF